MIPFVTAADIAIQPDGIGPKGIGLVVAVDIPRDGVAEQSAQHRAADHGAAIAMADRAAQDAAGNGPQDGSAGVIAAAAVIGEGAGGAKTQCNQGRGREYGLAQHAFLPN